MTMESTLASLTAGAAAWSGRDARGRAILARETALAVAGAAPAWVEAAVALKDGAAGGSTAAVVAEETATGPLATLRLLLVTARVADDIAVAGIPRAASSPRVLHPAATGSGSLVGIDVLPALGVADRAMFGAHQATIRCSNPGDAAAFARSWREEARDRPRRGGVAVVLGAGNVTGLPVADTISQIFEHGRGVLLKLHPLHAALEPVFRAALAPLISAGLLAIVPGGADVAAAAIASPLATHVHLTGGQAAFDAIVWGGGGPRPSHAVPRLTKPVTCELGGVTPWLVVPGRYSPAELAFQADLIAATIANNTSFNCIATKCVVTCRGWDQREEFLALVARRLESLPPRRGWYPGAAATWAAVTGLTPPADGTLPWILRTGIDPVGEPHWLEREWFVPVAVEVPLDTIDIETFCTHAMAFTRRLPGSLAASVTVPPALPPQDRHRVDLLVEHLEYGTVAVNTWSAIAYTLANVPWGGFPGATLAVPESGIGWVHDPLMLPLVHNSILRAPLLVRPMPPWFPWHRRSTGLAQGVVDVYAALARGRSGLWPLAKMLPAVVFGGR